MMNNSSNDDDDNDNNNNPTEQALRRHFSILGDLDDSFSSNNSNDNDKTGGGERKARMMKKDKEKEDSFHRQDSFRDYQSSGGSGTTGDETTAANNNNNNKKSDMNREEVARMALQETRNVKVWRRNVLVMILLMGALVTTLTYVFLKDEDQEDFDTAFHQFASTLEDSIQFNLEGVFQATQGLSQVLTSEAKANGETWPFVTLSSFEVHVGNTRAQASSELVVVAPLVTKADLEEWNTYSAAHQEWIDESFDVYGGRADPSPIPSTVYRFGRFKGRTVLVSEDGAGTYPAAPFWQMSPPPFDTSIVNFNSLSTETYQEVYDGMLATRSFVFGQAGANELINYAISQKDHDALHGGDHAHHFSHDSGETDSDSDETTSKEAGFANNHPHTPLIYPVFRELNSQASGIVAMVVNVLPWDNYLKDALPPGAIVYAVLHNSLGQSFTYVINGNEATYLGPGDMHDPTYDAFNYVIDVNSIVGGSDAAAALSAKEELSVNRYWLDVYPTQELEAQHNSNLPLIFAIVSGCGFLLMALTFLLYDYMVIRKNKKILDAAARSNAILSSLFPKNVKDQLMEEERDDGPPSKKVAFGANANKFNIHSSLHSADFDDGDILKAKPIADLFPSTTVMFADIVGFTAWSSTREPSSVFILLETLFRAFDKIAAKRNVYKVETIGDCYVAVTGLPEPRPDHAVVMSRFAISCMMKMQELLQKLEQILGPDTCELSMRFGLHSGPVTAGVLRGERGRFQLFGDTVNTAARIESAGKAGRVHLSQECADELTASGKGHWLEKRPDAIVAKGKGTLQTYWLNRMTTSPSEFHGSIQGSSSDGAGGGGGGVSVGPMRTPKVINEKTKRLIQWNVQRFSELLEAIAASRGSKSLDDDPSCATSSTGTVSSSSSNALPFEEVKEVISLSVHTTTSTQQQSAGTTGSLDPAAIFQLKEYITIVASMYDDHAFHNFDHCSHVCMSVLKMMSRFDSVTPNSSHSISNILEEEEQQHPHPLPPHTALYDFASDPLLLFSCAFSALIHDVLHPGVPNGQLMKEDPEAAQLYKSRSVAEQRSFDVAWDLLMESKFAALRKAIYQNKAEESKFRQLVLNSVMATDVFDPDLKKLRNDRWEKAFGRDGDNSNSGNNMAIICPDNNKQEMIDRQATIVIEHLIQASDVAHTMQHWHIYRKWNQRLFEEMYQAYTEGRSTTNPSNTWYQGELQFFDFYIIPLAKKLKDCGVFGVSSDEYLSFALKNRAEWESKGRAVVEEMTTICAERNSQKHKPVLIEGMP